MVARLDPAPVRRNMDRSDRDVVGDIDQLVEEIDASLGVDEECCVEQQAASRPELELQQVADVIEIAEPARARSSDL